MALGIAELIILSLIVDWLFRKCNIPGLVGMLLVGIITGPYVLGLLKPELINVSSDLRMIALIVILLRAGFEMSKDTLRKVGGRAILLSFIPAVMEGIAVTFLAHMFLRLTYMEAAILGAVLSAVSPAVVVPLMIRFIEERRGIKKGIPTLVLAASSIDDVFVIVIYSVLIGMYVGEKVNIVWKIAAIPISIATGIFVGILCGLLLFKIFRKFKPRATKQLLVILGVSILLVNVEHVLEHIVPFAALLAVMSLGFIILEKNQYMAHGISSKLGKLWVFAEIILFTLVGAQVNLNVAWKAGLTAILVISLALVARSIGTYLCLIRSNLTIPERLFVVVAYIPKATVQAAIGGAPLLAMKAAGMDTHPGEVILAVAVLSILLTAPIGAWAISIYGRRVLSVDEYCPVGGQLKEEVLLDKNKDSLASAVKVADVMDSDIVVVNQADRLKKAFDAFSSGDFLSLPVEGKQGKIVGMISLADVLGVLNEHRSWDVLFVCDAMSRIKPTLKPEMSVSEAFSVVDDMEAEQVPVTDGSGMPVGIFDIRKAKKFIEQKFIEMAGAS